MASSTIKIDCSICKLKFDEDHGVWVCLECTEKLTNAIHQASISPQPQIQLQQQQHKPHQIHHSRRSSLPEQESVSMTLFLELMNNGNKRRFKYKPSDLHRNISSRELQKHLLRRFAHDVDLKHLEIASQTAFEVNDKRHPHQFIMFETLRDLFDGCKIRININKYYHQKYKLQMTSNNKTAPYIRRRSKSASEIIADEFKMNDAQRQHQSKLKRKKTLVKVKDKAHGMDVISPVFSHKLRDNPSYGVMVGGGANDDSGSFDSECIIIDNGSGLMKCGFGGLTDNSAPHSPHIVFPTAIASLYDDDRIKIGKEAIQMGQVLSLPVTRPIKRGFITNWSEMECIWDEILHNKLATLCGGKHQYNLSNHGVLMTERYETPYKDREKLLQIMFESFDIASLYMAHSACLSIYGTGRTKGVVLDIGDGITSVVAMLEQNTGSKVIEFGGCDLTMDIQRKHKIKSFFDANAMKETQYSVPFHESDILKNKTSYELPDGRRIDLGKERMLKPLQFLFNKSNINAPQLVTDCIQSNDSNVQNVLWRNVVLSGGTTMMNGFAEKFARDIKQLTPVKSQVLAGRSRRYLPWLGAVVMSSISTFKNISISRAAYEEHGPAVVRKIKL
eukprot:131290_1